MGKILYVITRLIYRIAAFATRYRKAIEDVSVGLAQQIIVAALGIGTSILVARGLGPTSLGLLTLALSVGDTTDALSDLGIGAATVRYAAREIAHGVTDKANEFFRWAFRIRFVLVILASAVVYVGAPFLSTEVWHSNELVPLIRWAALLGAVSAFTNLSRVYFQSYQQFRISAVVSIGQKFIDCAGICLLAVLVWWTPGVVLAVKITCAAFGCLVLLVLIPGNVFFSTRDVHAGGRSSLVSLFKPPEPSLNAGEEIEASKPHLFVWYLFLSTLFVIFQVRFAVWFLGAYCPASEVGIYSAATRFALPLMYAVNAINAALWPRMAAHSSTEGLTALVRSTLRVTVPVGAVAALYSIAAPLAAPFIFGEAYVASVIPAQVTCLAYCVVMIANPLGVIAYGFGLEKAFAILNLCQTVVSVPLLILLIPPFGATGGALTHLIVTMLGGIATCCLVFGEIRRRAAPQAGRRAIS